MVSLLPTEWLLFTLFLAVNFLCAGISPIAALNPPIAALNPPITALKEALKGWHGKRYGLASQKVAELRVL